MALNFQTLKTRALTALIFVLVMLAGLLWNKWSFLLLVSIIHFGCWIEYLKLVEKIKEVKIDDTIKYFLAICGFTLMLVFGIRHVTVDAWVVIFGEQVSVKLISWMLLFTGMLVFLLQNKQITPPAKWMILGGFIYISLSLTLFLNLREATTVLTYSYQSENGDSVVITNSYNDLGKLVTCGLVFSIWINDTMAYLVGSMIGRTPLSSISPKKTWEGTAGGALLCVAAIGLAGNFIPVARNLSVWHWVAIAAICAVFGTLGDLFESKLKRMADVKDSGSIMPGHGGFLDRFDSMLWAAPMVWLYVKLFV